MPKYEVLSDQITELMEAENESGSYARVAFDNNAVIRRKNESDKANVWRKPFIRDIDKIMVNTMGDIRGVDIWVNFTEASECFAR